MFCWKRQKLKYDIHLFEQLNEEYRSKPIMTSFRQYDPDSELRTARSRLHHLNELVSLDAQKVLEIGCGRGYLSKILASEYRCSSVVGIDIRENDEWNRLRNGTPILNYQVVDLCNENPFAAESFDIILSFVVWEHIIHPFTMLRECCRILKPSGAIYIYANQYRSPRASHRYRLIHFPFPHLLFDNEVISEYFTKQGIGKVNVAHLNKLTYSHYKEYFGILNLTIEHERLVKIPLDVDFYNRFKDKLELYPRFDLELDTFEVILRKGNSATEQVSKLPEPNKLKSELQLRIQEIKQIRTELQTTKQRLVKESNARALAEQNYLHIKNASRKIETELNRESSARVRAEQNYLRTKKAFEEIRGSTSYQLGHVLVQAVRKPGRNTLLLPYRLIRLFSKALRK
jgi:SAM-dependent methyltransferase